MKLKRTPSITTALVALFTFTAGVAYSQGFTRVEDIIDLPRIATNGVPLTLTGTVKPENATLQEIIWTVKDQGNTGAKISDNILSITNTGKVILAATIIGGLVTNFSAGAVHTAAIREDGSLWTWGDNWVYQLGLGPFSDDYYDTPYFVSTGWATVSAGGYWEGTEEDFWYPDYHYYYMIGLKTNGTLWAWGDNQDGQLGNGSNSIISIHAPVPIGTNDNWAAVSAHTHTIALQTDGSLWAWGDNRDGQLGISPWVARTNEPVRVGLSNDWAIVTAGFSCTMAIKTNGTLWAWGNNLAGQLGISPWVAKTNQPVQVGKDDNWFAVAPGFQHTVALQTNGTLWAWGNNYCGAFGDGTLTSTNAPIQIGEDTDWVAVAAGGDGNFDSLHIGDIRNYTLALKKDGTLWAWGDNRYGQLGISPWVASTNLPAQVGTDTNWVDISTTSVFVMARKTDGSLWAWGGNYEGQIGDGTTINRLSPVRVHDLGDSTFTTNFPVRVINRPTVLGFK